MKTRLNILVLSAEPPYPPTHGGARLKLFHLLRELSGRHDFTLLTLLESPEERAYLPELEKLCRNVVMINHQLPTTPPALRERFQAPFYRLAGSEKMAVAIRRELQEQRFDLVHVDRPHMAVYTPLLAGQHKVIAATDSSTLAYASSRARAGTLREKLRYTLALHTGEAFERRVYPEYDACVVVADPDARAITRLCPKLPVRVIPNGVDLNFFTPTLDPLAVPLRLAFTGTMDFDPNVDAALWFAREIFARIRNSHPDVRFDVIGRAPTPAVQALASQPGIVVTGFVEDLRPLLAQAAVYVCPLRCGSGIKNKTLEAMAMGKAIVSTPEGVSGIQGHDGEQYLVRAHAEEFASAVVSLLEEPARCRQLGRAARTLVEQRYSWTQSAKSYETVYRETAASR